MAFLRSPVRLTSRRPSSSPESVRTAFINRSYADVMTKFFRLSQPLYILQKKAVRIIAFSSFDEHSTPLFRLLAIMKISDLVTFHIALFMHKFYNKLLPSYFDSFFNPVLRIHNYNTRSAANQSYYLPRARTNYGIFNIRFQGPNVWNSQRYKVNPFRRFKKKNN